LGRTIHTSRESLQYQAFRASLAGDCMTRTIFALAVAGTIAVFSLPIQAQASEQSGVRNQTPHEYSSRKRKVRHARVAGLRYYDPYPWWWHPPHVARARTNYLGWPHSYYPPDYDKPYFGGVAGYPGGFWLQGL
jgi:hypothetical protein